MSQQNTCRLCANSFEHCKSFYDEKGRPNSLHRILVKLFHPPVINIHKYKHLKRICLQCWGHIREFCKFQMSIARAQLKLVEIVPMSNDNMEDLEEDEEFINIDNNTENAERQEVYEARNAERNGTELSLNLSMGQREENEFHNVDKASMSEEVIILSENTCSAAGQTPCLQFATVKQEHISTDEELTLDDVSSMTKYQDLEKSFHSRNFETNSHIMASSNENDKIDITVSIKQEVEENANISDEQNDEATKESEQLITVKEGDIVMESEFIPDHHNQMISRIPALGKSSLNKGHEDNNKDFSSLAKSSDLMSIAAYYKYELIYFDPDFDKLEAKLLVHNPCCLCAKVFASLKDLAYHFRFHHPKAEMFVTCCSRSFKQIADLKKHLRDEHSQVQRLNLAVCHLCKAFSGTKEEIDKHIKIRHQPKFITCRLCTKTFTNKTAFERHYLKFHSSTQKYLALGENLKYKPT
uniref:C2H2-type domain-containing protein n=1 Tax=Stomoxys calcitrans TaxID=35570 RepID=A0A1I8PLA3_STOCA